LAQANIEGNLHLAGQNWIPSADVFRRLQTHAHIEGNLHLAGQNWIPSADVFRRLQTHAHIKIEVTK
jgi:hypothetical protein